MNRFLRIIDGVSEWSGRIFSFVVLGATMVVVYEVVMRYGFNSPTAWGFELPIYLLAASYLLSGAYAHKHDAHVRVDLLYARWSPRVRAIVDIITAPVFFVGLIILLRGGAEWTLLAMERGTTTGTQWNVIVWPIRLLVPLGSFLLLCQGFAKFVRDLQTARSGGPA